jgi:hypothetical protein
VHLRKQLATRETSKSLLETEDFDDSTNAKVFDYIKGTIKVNLNRVDGKNFRVILE